MWVARQSNTLVLEGLAADVLNYSTMFFIIDILQLAGICLAGLVLIKHSRMPGIIVAIIALLITVISPYLWGISSLNPFFDFFLDLLWGDRPLGGFVENAVSFPLFPWAAFPLWGYFFASCMSNYQNEEQALSSFAKIAVLPIATGSVLLALDFSYHFNDYYHPRFGAMIFMSGFVFVWLWICNFFIRWQPAWIISFFTDLSKNVTSIYFIQWLLVIWSIALFKANSFNSFQTLAMILGIFVSTYWLNAFWVLMKKTVLMES
jgi:hypothetical protein